MAAGLRSLGGSREGSLATQFDSHSRFLHPYPPQQFTLSPSY